MVAADFGPNSVIGREIALLRKQLADLALGKQLQLSSSDGDSSQMVIHANADGAGNAGLKFVNGTKTSTITSNTSGNPVSSNGFVVSNGGLAVSRGGATVHGSHTVYDGFSVATGASSFAGNITVNSGGATVNAGGLDISGNSAFRSNLTVTSGGINVNANGLSVTGSASIFNGLAVDGNLTVTNGTKNFVMDHPLDPTKKLVHAATESPVNGVEYWGTVTLSATGTATVTLPDYFEKLTAPDTRAVILTLQGAVPAPVAATAIASGAFTVTGPANGTVSWLVKARRVAPAGATMLDFDPEPTAIPVIGPPPPGADLSRILKPALPTKPTMLGTPAPKGP